jgi:hypothetical protein
MGAIQMQLSSERSRRGSSKTDGRGHSMFDPTEIVPVGKLAHYAGLISWYYLNSMAWCYYMTSH